MSDVFSHLILLLIVSCRPIRSGAYFLSNALYIIEKKIGRRFLAIFETFGLTSDNRSLKPFIFYVFEFGFYFIKIIEI